MPPSQGNDNSSTSSWQPKSRLAPSANWQSTYGVHYTDPGRRLTRNHDYWLRKAAQRAANTTALQNQGYVLQGRGGHTFREPSLKGAYNSAAAVSASASLRNPSSLPRTTGGTGVLAARPLHAALRDTSVRSFDSFAASTAQRYYAQNEDVSALRVLEGQAAGLDRSVPIKATSRPSRGERTEYVHSLDIQEAEAARRMEARQRHSQQRPATAGLTRRPAAQSFGASQSFGSSPPQHAWGEEEGHFQGATSSLQPLAYTERTSHAHASPLGRSQTFRPQLSVRRASSAIPANRLLAVAAAPDRVAQRHAEWQGNEEYEVLEL